MRAVQLFRKLDPAEWGGTETAMHRLFTGLRETGVTPLIFCPRIAQRGLDPFRESGFRVERFKAFVPIVGMSQERKRQLVAVGGNLMSFDLISLLLREKDASLIHTHALGRIGAIGRTVARRRGIPFLVTIHGGLLDLPPAIKASFNAQNDQGFDWGKLFSLLFQSHRLIADADAVLTCNEREAELLRERYPEKRIVYQPHAVPIEPFEQNHRAAAVTAWPQIENRKVILSLGRVDPIKNQVWLIDHAAPILASDPDTMVVLAGACTDEPYGRMIEAKVASSGFSNRILLTGGLSATDPRLIGLLQSAAVLVLPSLSETFGLVLLEAWAAGTMVMSSKTSGGKAMIDHGENGWLFDLDDPAGFQEKLQLTLSDPAMRRRMADCGGLKASTRYSIKAVASQVRSLYEDLIGEKRCAT